LHRSIKYIFSQERILNSRKQKPAIGWLIPCCVGRININRLAQAANGSYQAGTLSYFSYQ
jgi:hypothetical protein